MSKSIIIIGAGFGGLASGIYGQLNGYQTRIFEMQAQPGGQCVAWNRNGYTFDGCIHHFFGSNSWSRFYQLWSELGVMPHETVDTVESVRVFNTDGRSFHDYYNVNQLEQHLLELAPADVKGIKEYVGLIKLLSKDDLLGELSMGTTSRLIGLTPTIARVLRYLTMPMQQYAERFTDPFMRRIYPLLIYSWPRTAVIEHLIRHAYGSNNAIQWPVGGSREISRCCAQRYIKLGGEIHYRKKVKKILVENDRAVGIVLDDGSEYRADIVISNADGRKTILDMLDGKYVNKHIKSLCTEPQDNDANYAVEVFLGVARELGRDTSAYIVLLDKPAVIAGHTCKSLFMQNYGFDRTMTPRGKGLIKVDLISKYSYWKQLNRDKNKYYDEKKKVVEQVIAELEPFFHGIRGRIEMTDVATPVTWERYMGGTHGFSNLPNRKPGLSGKQEFTLPGLTDFYFTGVWASAEWSLFGSALSGRKLIQLLCTRDGRHFNH